MDFYGKQYYQDYVTKQQGFPSIEERARLDLPERCLHWLRAMLKYKLPPAHVLELGSAHGGFVALLGLAGYDARGLEMSPWLVGYAKETFGIDVLNGPIEFQQIPSGTLDAIALFDVLEHFPDPLGTMKVCASLVRNDGLIVVQTPEYPAGTSFKDLMDAEHEFVRQLKPKEHIVLFSRQSVEKFFRTIGLPHIGFEPAIFAHYDMFLVASPSPLDSWSSSAIEGNLARSSGGRFVQALLDQESRIQALMAELTAARGDRDYWRKRFESLDADRLDIQ